MPNSSLSKRPEVIFFDAGGTLIHLDHTAIGEICGIDAATAKQLAPSADAAARERVAEQLRVRSESTDATRLELFFAVLAEHFGLHGEARETAVARITALHKTRNLFCRADEYAAGLLHLLRRDGYRVAVISNADGRVELTLREAGLTTNLETVIDSFHAGFEKPDPRIFKAACEQLDVQTTDCLYVGDIYDIDIIGARAAGMPALLLDPTNRYPNADCPRIHSLEELPAWLARYRN